MQVNYIFGNNKTGKTTFIANKVKEYQDNNEQTIVIVPEQMNLSTEILLINILESILNVQVYSFMRLSNKIFQESGIRNLATLEETGKLMLLKLILNRNEKNFQYYKKSTFKYGFISELSNFISDFFKNGITVNEINNIVNNEETSEIVKLKLQDIKIILEEYNKFLENQLLSTDGTLDLLAEKISGSNFFDNMNIIIDGFYGFTEQEYKVIEKLINKVKSITITFNVNISKPTSYFSNLNRLDPYYEPKKTVNKISDIISENNLKVDNIKIIEQQYEQKEDLAFLKQNYLLYKNKNKYEQEAPNITLYACKNKVVEITVLSKNICKLVNMGYTYNDIKVICGDINEYKTILQGIFTQYEIPFFIDEKDDIMQNSFTVLINGFFKVITSNFSFVNVMNLLKIEIFLEDKFSRYEVENFENYILEYGIKGYQFKNEFTYGLKNKKYDLEAINNTRMKMVLFISYFMEDFELRKKYKVIDITKKFFDFLVHNDISGKIEKIILKAIDENDLKRKSEYEQVWDKVIDLLDKIVSILGDEEVTLKEYSEILEQGLNGITLGIIPISQNEVVVGDFQRSKISKSKAVFLIGGKDDLFPLRPKESPIISDLEKDALSKQNKKIVTTTDVFLKQNLLIYDILVTASEKLIISYPIYSLKGELNTKSNVIRKIEDLFPKNLIQTFDENIITNKKTMLPLAISLVKKQSLNLELNEKEEEFLAYYKSDNEYLDKIEIAKKVIEGYKPDEKISDEAILELYSNKMLTSVSKLERYAKCPFSYFLEYNLRLKDRKMFEILNVDIGQVFHNILDMFVNNANKKGKELKEVTEEEVPIIIDEIVSNLSKDELFLLFRNSYRYSYYLERILKIMKDSINALIYQLNQGEFEIFQSELEFGRNGISEIVINLDNNKEVIITGKVDRVDIYKEEDKRYIKIIDYKSSSKKISEEEITLGTQLQLFAYLNVLLKNGNKIFGEADNISYLPGGVYYFEIKSAELVGVNFSNFDFEELEILKNKKLAEYKLSGVTYLEDDIYSKIDTEIVNKLVSDIIQFKLTKDFKVDKRSTFAYDKVKFEEILNSVEDKIKELSDDIYKGKITIDYNKSSKLQACNWCNFSAICKKDKL